MLAQLAKKYDLELVTTSEVLSLDNVGLAEGADGVSGIGFSQFTRPVLERLRELGIRSVSSRCVGTDHIDLAAAKELGFSVANAQYSPWGVAEYTVMLMLIALRHYKEALWLQQVNDFSIAGLQGKELGRLTVGIVGTGRIGKAVMHILKGFGCDILCYSRHQDAEAAALGTYVSLEELYAKSDIISLHLPYNEQTFQMINRESLAKMKKGVLLINCARGELMDIADVIDAIEQEQLGGLALDVFENENGIYHQNHRLNIIKNRDMAYLRQFPNVIMTQHIAFYTQNAVDDMVRCGIESLIAFERGEKHPCCVVSNLE